MIVAILGIGEAGGTLARDLVAVGVTVRAWDPNPPAIPEGVEFAANNATAVSGADIVLSVNWASVAVEVAAEVAPVLQPQQLYSDLNTASPQNKRAVAAIIEKTGALFVDTAVMAPVPPKGLRTAVSRASKPHLGVLTAISRASKLHLGVLTAISRVSKLHLGALTAVSRA